MIAVVSTTRRGVDSTAIAAGASVLSPPFPSPPPPRTVVAVVRKTTDDDALCVAAIQAKVVARGGGCGTANPSTTTRHEVDPSVLVPILEIDNKPVSRKSTRSGEAIVRCFVLSLFLSFCQN